LSALIFGPSARIDARSGFLLNFAKQWTCSLVRGHRWEVNILYFSEVNILGRDFVVSFRAKKARWFLADFAVDVGGGRYSSERVAGLAASRNA